MCSSILYIMLFLLGLTSLIGSGCCINMFRLNVPRETDLQDDAVTLDCRYDMGQEDLYSVKWYKDEQEFFRFVPSAGGPLSFPVAGIHISNAEDVKMGKTCDLSHCPVTLVNISRITAGTYRCEVSSEAPTFRVFFDTANMSIIALPKGKVIISTPKTQYMLGDDIWINCTAPAADPAPYVRWFVNDVSIDPGNIVSQSDSAPDDQGLVIRSLSARMEATRELFTEKSGLLELKCQVDASSQAPLHSTLQISLQEMRGQSFDWLSSSGTSTNPCILLSIYTLTLLYSS